MTIEDLTSTLEERGVLWQGSGFALIGAISLLLLSLYSEADHWSVGIYRLAVTQLSWAFVLAIAVAIEGIRSMFRTTTEIRKAAREKFIVKEVAKAERRGRKEGEKLGEERGKLQAIEQVKADLREQGIELSPEAEQRLLKKVYGRKWWRRIPPFRS